MSDRNSTTVWIAAVLVVTAFLLAGPAAAFAVSFPVANHSFETNDLADGTNASPAAPPNWTVTGGGASYLDRNSGAFNTVIDPTPDADGEQLVWSNGGDLYQTLSTVLTANTTYALAVDVGDRTDVNPYAGAQLRLGTGSTFGSNLLTARVAANTAPVNGGGAGDGWQTWVSTFTTGASPAGLGNPLRVELINPGGGQTLFDNVRLDRLNVINGTFESLTGNGVPGTLSDNQYVHFFHVGNSGMSLPIDITGWSQSGGASNGAGLYNPPAGDPGGQPPSAVNLLFINNNLDSNHVAQAVGQNLQTDTFYTLNFQHGARGGNGAFQVQLLAGGTLLDESTGAGTVGAWQKKTVFVNSADFPGQVGQPLEVRILEPAATGQTTYDNFSLAISGDTIVMDNEEPGFSVSAATTALVSPYTSGYNDDRRWFSNAGSGWAKYDFTNVPNGVYDVYANWIGQSNTDPSTTYTLSDGGGVVTKSQFNNNSVADLALVDPLNGGSLNMELLQANVSITDGNFDVTVTVPTAGYFAFVDAIALQLIPEPSTFALAAIGLLALLAWGRRRRCMI